MTYPIGVAAGRAAASAVRRELKLIQTALKCERFQAKSATRTVCT